MTNNTPRIDADGALEDRDAILNDIADRNSTFIEDAQQKLATLYGLLPPTFLAEDIRLLLLHAECRPHSPYVWGPFIKVLVRKGILEETGRWLPTRAKGSHAGRSPEYRLVTSNLQGLT